MIDLGLDDDDSFEHLSDFADEEIEERKEEEV